MTSAESGVLYSGKSLAAHECSGVEEQLASTKGVVYGFVLDIDTGDVVDSFPSPFFTALVWDELISMRGADLRLMGSAIDFLLNSGSCEEGWLFFPAGGGYPPDADDTAVVASFLLRVGALSEVDKLVQLLNANQRSDGRFYVWLADASGRRNCVVDPIVDLNVALFLWEAQSGRVELPFSVSQVEAQFPHISGSSFYDDPGVCSWFLSRFDRRTRASDCKISVRHDRLLAANDLTTRSYKLLYAVRSSYGVIEPSIIDRPKSGMTWLFRHSKRKIGYGCPLFETIALMSAVCFAESKERDPLERGTA